MPWDAWPRTSAASNSQPLTLIDTRADRSGPDDKHHDDRLNKTIPVTLDCRAMS